MLKLGEIASLVGGTLHGDAGIEIKGVSPLEDAVEGTLSFVLDKKLSEHAELCPSSALIVPEGVVSSKPYISVPNTRLALSKVLEKFKPCDDIFSGVHPSAYIGKDVSVGKDVKVYPFVFIGDGSSIGDGTVIHPNTTIYPRSVIGKNCIIHAGCVIGVDGFGFVRPDKHYIKIPQNGRVVIEDDVELYANNCIARGTIGDTVIKKGSKIDNLNHIAHNVRIGSDCALTVFNAFGGSSSLGNDVQMSGQCGLAPRVHVGDGSVLMGRAGVTKDCAPGSVLLGFPAQDHIKETRIQALVRKLPELFSRIKTLEDNTPKK